MEIANPRKVNRLRLFYELFGNLVNEWMNGKHYSDEEIVLSPYFKYLRAYHSVWMKEPMSDRVKREIIRRWRDGEQLFYDIKQNGMKNPIEMLLDGKDTYIRRGNRRLTILKVLGTEFADVCYADKDYYETKHNNTSTE